MPRLPSCREIVEASRLYQESMEGRIWDVILEPAPILQAYILYGEGPKGIREVEAAKLLWSMLAVWGNVWKQMPDYDTRGCSLYRWVRSEGEHLIKTLREHRSLLQRLASLPEAPEPGLIEAHRGDITRLYELVKSARCIGDTAAAKTIAILTLFHLPPLDNSIARRVIGKELSGSNDYIEAALRLAELLQECLRDSSFQAYLAERRATGAVVRAKPFKILDEGIWYRIWYIEGHNSR